VIGTSRSLPILVVAVLSATPGSAHENRIDFFETRIRPALVEHCYRCHSAGAKRLRGGLRLDSRARVLRGGDSGPAIVPGDPDGSRLVRALRYDGLEMPPAGKLPDAVIADFARWVALGAPDPRVESEAAAEDAAAAPSPPTHRSPSPGWVFVPPSADITPPAVRASDWPRSDIDRFILARVEAAGLAPAADADRATLARRLCFDLTGLPPAPAEIDAFVADDSPRAREDLVDRLLASFHFAERFGRHWLDVARYSDSTGGGRTRAFDDAWRYRDWAIESFHRDKPFDRFVREQIAGDLLASDIRSADIDPAGAAALARRVSAEREALVATAFLVLGPHNYENQDKDLLRMDVVDEQIDTTGRAFLGMTLGCARCHDHKFDPVPTRDYYALAGIFRSTKTLTPGNVAGFEERRLPVAGELAERLAEHERAVAELESRIQSARAELAALAKLTSEATSPASPLAGLVIDDADDRAARRQRLEAARKDLERDLAALREKGPAWPTAIAPRDEDEPGDWRIHIRGEIRNLGAEVERGFLTAAGATSPPAIAAHESGRRELAEWIASPANPLTARVWVNRVWCWLIGEGIVRSVDNFGNAGESPSHPQLLDWLATRFVAEGWSTKKLVREIVLSRTYGLSSAASDAARRLDPENVLLASAHRRRLDVESMRDAILLVSGELDLTPGGPSIETAEGRKADAKIEYGYRFTTRRRSVYVPVFRNGLFEMFEVFDFADPNLSTGRRVATTRATQALYLLNSPFVIEQSRRAAARWLAAYDDVDDATRVVRAYREVLGRAPSDAELAGCVAYLGAEDEPLDDASAEPSVDRVTSERTAGDMRSERWAGLAQTLFACVDFRFLD